jgi:hypothetical protein
MTKVDYKEMFKTNGRSYDERMESVPLLISYPRSGSNWLNCVLELYFNRPRLRVGPVSYLKDSQRKSGFMWFHDHDIHSDLVVSHSDIVYLYRNPDDVIYSLLSCEVEEITDNLVDTQINLLKNHYEKYLKIKDSQFLCVKYEDLKRGATSMGFRKLINYFSNDNSFDMPRLNNCLSMVKKDDVINMEIDKRYFSKKLTDSDYNIKRQQFKNKYTKKIYDELISSDLTMFFR